VGNIAREGVQTCITNLDISMTPVMNGCCNDDMTQLRLLQAQSPFQFVQISDEYFEHILLQYSPHSVINCIGATTVETGGDWSPQLLGWGRG